MAVFFNCSYGRAAIKSYTQDLMSRNNTLSIDARLDRRKNFQQQFSFTDAEVTLNPGLKTFMSATEDSDRFLLTGTGTSL